MRRKKEMVFRSLFFLALLLIVLEVVGETGFKKMGVTTAFSP
jgi:hypothetical protein